MEVALPTNEIAIAMRMETVLLSAVRRKPHRLTTTNMAASKTKTTNSPAITDQPALIDIGSNT
jgi:hypothetical protein